ncbi:MAG: flagellar basal-body rod protein [Planctomycetota bacterium]|nr:MAG: flagellar basal-body rod protein [Planctomycetota bacterium]
MDITNAGAIPTLESALAFSWKRHEVILNNIANASTPGFRGSDLPVDTFQAALRKAAGIGRAPEPMVLGGIPVRPEVASGSAVLRSLSPVPTGGIPGHDGNDVVPEIEAAKMAKNAAIYTALTQLLSRQFDLIEKAIRERP